MKTNRKITLPSGGALTRITTQDASVSRDATVNPQAIPVKPLSRLLWDARERLGLSRAELAFKCNLSERSIQNYETEKRSPHITALCRLSGPLGLRFVVEAGALRVERVEEVKT